MPIARKGERVRCELKLPANWVNASTLEQAIRRSGTPHGPETFEVEIRFPAGCKVMVDAAIRLLSLANQLSSTTRRVCLVFDEGEEGTMGYLNRMGFFDHLATDIEVT